MATIRRTRRILNPFQVSAARARKIPARTALRYTGLRDSPSASSALTILTRNNDMNATRKAANEYSVPLEKTDVEMGRERNANTSAATTPTFFP